MPLPTTDTEWPPPATSAYENQAKGWAAWWSGDVEGLAAKSLAGRFWKRQELPKNTNQGSQSRVMHAAVAADIATTSADLLFGEPVTITIPEPVATGQAGEQVDGDTTTGDASIDQAAAAVELTQARLDELRDDLDLDGVLLEAGEVASALGGAWLRPVWDDAVADHPLLTVEDPLHTVPEYRLRKLTAVTFWEDLPRKGGGEDGVVWRHLERHEIRLIRSVADDGTKGPVTGRTSVILHGLYRGDDTKLGTRMALTDHSSTAGYDEEVPVPAAMDGQLLPVYLPNVLPNRKSRTQPRGRSDFDGIEGELDSIDEVWSALLRDVRMGVARIIAPEGTLTKQGTGAGAGRGFDVDEELIVEYDAAPDDTGVKFGLVQGQVRSADLLATIRGLVEQAVNGAGYAPATFGLGIDGAAESGTARAIRERKTFRTLGRKRRYAERAIADLVWRLLVIDADLFKRAGIVAVRPRIGWPDLTADPKGVADRLQILRTAQAISIENAVKEAQPELEGQDLADEVQRIMTEMGAGSPDPATFGADAPAYDENGDLIEAPEEFDPEKVKAAFDAMASGIRSGVEPEDAAAAVGLSVRFTGAVPVTLRQPAADAAKLEDA